MKRWVGVICCVLAAACDQRVAPLAAYQRPRDALASVLPLSVIGIYPCASRVKEDNLEVIFGMTTERCFKMLPQRRYRGIWLDEFEGSRFFDGASEPGEVRRRILAEQPDDVTKSTWLSWADDNAPSSENSRLVVIDFVGRGTAYSGRYGHFGMSDNEIVVDRVLSMHTVYQSAEHYMADESGKR